jgi:tricorn protease-like protein
MSADFSPDGRRVVTSDNQGHLRLWNVEQCIRRFVCTGGLVIGRRVADGNMNGVDFSPDGKLVGVAANWDGVELVDVASGKMWFQGPSEDGQILAVAFSADGDKLLAAGARGGVVVWDISSCHTTKAECTPTKKDVYHGTVVISLAVDPHNARVLTAGYDRIARLWKLSRLGRETPVRLEGHTGPIDSARFDDTGTRIVTAGLDGTIRVWDTASGDLLGVIRGHGGEVTRAEFAPGSSSTILSAGVDGTAQINTCECGSPGRLGDEMKAAEKREDGISRKPVPLIGR